MNRRYMRSLKLAADSVDTLRKGDVYRVLQDAANGGYLSGLAACLRDERPDLLSEIDECAAELS